MDLRDCKLTLEWKDPRTGERSTTTISLGRNSADNEEVDIFLIDLRAAFKVLYRKVLEKLGFDKANVIGRLASQMKDLTESKQKESVKQHIELFKEIEK